MCLTGMDPRFSAESVRSRDDHGQGKEASGLSEQLRQIDEVSAIKINCHAAAGAAESIEDAIGIFRDINGAIERVVVKLTE